MGRASLLRKRHSLHHPEHVTAGAMARGRFLEPKAEEEALHWRMGRFRQLRQLPILSLSFKDRHLLATLKLEFEPKNKKQEA